MFVHLRGSAGWIIQDASTFHHRLGEMMDLRQRHPAKKNRHRPGAHLVIRDLAVGESRDEIVDFLGAQLLAFAFFLDE